MTHRLPPDLYEEIVNVCTPLFRLGEDRDACLLGPLSRWAGFDQIEWGGSARTFTTRLVRQLPAAELQAVLRSLVVGEGDKQQIAILCQRIEAAQPLMNTHTDPVVIYHQEQVKQFTAQRYQLDSRFVQLTLLVDQGPETQGIRFVQDERRGKYQNLQQLLDDILPDRAVVLLGQPGSGKTTLLRRLLLERAWRELEQPTGQLPFLLSLNGHDSSQPLEPRAWLAQEWLARYPSLPAFEPLFQAGRLLLLLDGLNEMPHQNQQDYRERIGRWQRFVQNSMHYGNTMVFSCRSLDYSASLSSETVPVRQVQVESLNQQQIEQFLTLYLGEQSQDVWHTLQRNAAQLALFATPFFLRLLVEEVAETGHIPQGQAGLLTGFVRRALQREVVEHRHRLFAPNLLLSEDDVQQIIRRAWGNAPYILPDEGVLIPAVERLAFAMQNGQTAGEARQVRMKEQAARELLAHAQAGELITAAIQLNVLDKDITAREIFFYHQLLQEYFAARVLAQKPDPARLNVPWQADKVVPSLAETLAGLAVSDALPGLPTTGWEETAVLAAAMSHNQEQFVQELMGVNLPLAARCAAAPEVRIFPTLKQQVQQSLLERIANPQADLRARIAAAEALGELGDPRFVRREGAFGVYLQPPLVAVPGGTYRIGSETAKGWNGLKQWWARVRGTYQSGYDDEKPAHDVQIAAFEMGMFPVTNAEYRLFMEAGGYEEERWWETEAARAWRRGQGSGEGPKQAARDQQKYLQGFSEEVIHSQQVAPNQIEFWLWLRNVSSEELERQYEDWYPAGKVYRQPEFWENGRFNHASQPVVGVTWFEARAYCAWLSAQTGETYSLPTEAEWETSARGFTGRVYAYGHTYDMARCNTFETHIRSTTPVGVFPGGQTPEGIADLSGNVWEWTSTLWGSDFNRPTFGYPYVADDGREDPADGATRRVVRGGSWDNNQGSARAASRDHAHPDGRFYSQGFRVVRRPPSLGH